MRIKLNLMQLIPDRKPSIYWLHIDMTCITLIKQLKLKVQKVLKESRDIELCFDSVPFLDEDDINAINENEEITVTVKKSNIHDEQKYETNNIEVDMIPANTNGVLNPCREDVITNNDNELLKVSKKRIRKRTHKKKNKIIEPVENDSIVTLSETSIVSSKEDSKMHKRFKLDTGENNQQDDSIDSDEETFHVTREVFHYNSPALMVKEKNTIDLPVWKKEKPYNIKLKKVPVFVRGQTCTDMNSTQKSSHTDTENNKSSDSIISEHCDMLVVDWKNMSQIKITNLTELQIYDLLQFKIMSMNECGEPQLSSVITARLDHIYKCTLHIQVLSGAKEFMSINPKFRIDHEEDIGTQREIEFDDLFEICKLV